MKNIKSLLITGGTGSFGRTFTNYILENVPTIKRLAIFSRDELKQHEMMQSINPKHLHKLRFFIGDIRDKPRVKIALENVQAVVHAAALKQVPSAERNPFEVIKTNIIGAQNLIEGCIENNVKKVVALSTDKAAGPINLYGATKLCSDKLFTSARSYVGKRNIKFSVVRYGNVINSRGSVIPVFKEYAIKKKFIPITDRKMTRFWISLDQGVKFIIKCFSRMQGGEIFVPKIPSIKIVDIAKSLYPNVKIKFIGIRPGEKLHEVMCPRDDSHLTLEFKDHYIIKPSISFTRKINYSKNSIGEKGNKVNEDFEYNSLKNKNFLNIKSIKKLIQKT